MAIGAGFTRNFVAATAAVLLGPLIGVAGFLGIVALRLDGFALAWIYAVALAPALLCGMVAYIIGCRWFSIVVGLIGSACAVAPIAYVFSHLNFSGM